MKAVTQRLKAYKFPLIIVAVLVFVGLMMIVSSQAQSFVISREAELGSVGAPAVTVPSASASGGSYVSFQSGSSGTSTTPNFKVAFLGDQGVNSNAKAVLSLIKAQGADLIVHLGDFDYGNNPSAWESQTTSIMGSTFPQMAVIGNHDDNVAGYQAQIAKRTAPATCSGSRGVRAVCKMNGLVVIEEGIGVTSGSNNSTDVSFVRDTLAANSSALWKVCAWHEQMAAMQVGGKGDSTGWDVFEECRKAGALVFTGHEHSYQRTKTLTSFANQTVDPTCNTVAVVCVGPNRSFTAVSGLAGIGVRDQRRCMPSTPPYGCKGEWASVYTTNQGAKYGALFITFNVNNNPKLAKAEFRNISNQVIDSFEIRRD